MGNMLLATVTFDPTVTLGTVIQSATVAIAIIAAYHAIRNKLDMFTSTMTSHAEALEKHSERLDRHEEKILDLVGGLQRVIGQSEMVFRANPRRDHRS